MSLFQWFTRKSPPKYAAAQPSSGLAHVDATVPAQAGHSGGGKAGVGSAANRKNERLERRELLYAVVRNAMTRAGVLTSSYKFKVLSLDSRGRQYLIMMDLARKDTGATDRLSEIEGLIAQRAKNQHDILVTAVYWRVNEHVTAGLTRPVSVPTAPAPLARTVPATPQYEPLQEDEVAAFKKAITAAQNPVSLSAPGEIVRSGRRNPAPVPAEEYEVDRRASPLSGTQYGELN